MISSVIFKDQDDNILSKVTPGTRGRLTVIVKDTRINSEEEFEKFKYRMLSKSRKKIFAGSGKINFYSCIYEYFMYAEDIETAHLKACLKCPDVTGELYRIYLKYEYLNYHRMAEIEELLGVLEREQEEQKQGGQVKSDEEDYD